MDEAHSAGKMEAKLNQNNPGRVKRIKIQQQTNQETVPCCTMRSSELLRRNDEKWQAGKSGTEATEEHENPQPEQGEEENQEDDAVLDVW